MTARKTAVVLLAVAWGCGGVYAQAGGAPATGKTPVVLSIRDNQGKMVPLPEPNPAQPVDYVKWFNETLSKGVKDNAADVYAEAYRLYKDTGLKEDERDKALKGPWEDLESG